MLSKIKKYGTIKHMITKNGLSNMCEIIQNINEVTSVKVAETYTHTHTHTHTHLNPANSNSDNFYQTPKGNAFPLGV